MAVMVSMGAHTLIELHGSWNGVVSPVWRPTFLSTAQVVKIEKSAKERHKLTSPHQKTMRVPENCKAVIYLHY